MFKIMSDLILPDQSTSVVEQSINQLEICSSSIKKQQFEIERCVDAVNPDCQICQEKFDDVSNQIFAKHINSDIDTKNKELKDVLDSMNDPGIPLDRRRVALSCGHDKYH